MPIQLDKILGKGERPWGYEVRVDFIDKISGRIYNEVLTFKVPPAEIMIDDEIQRRITK